ncbi:MAG: DUF4843 domain-containing protein [Aestuariibaculum sp.]
MEKYKYILTLIGSITLLFSACSKDELEQFDTNTSHIYFEWAKEGTNGLGLKSSQYIDSLNISFAYELPSFTDSIINVPVKLLGYTTKTERVVNLKVLTSSSAIQDTHYEIPTSVTFPADSVRTYIPVKIKRDAALKDQVAALKFELLPNQYFDTAIFTTQESTDVDRAISFTQFEITFSDILTEPKYWFILKNYLGDFSAKKLYLFAELNGISVPNYNELPNISTFLAQVRILKTYLAQQKAAGTPILEEDGTEMKLGPYA